MPSPKCHRTKDHCRPLKGSKKASPGKACNRTIQGVTHYGTRVKGYYSPKSRCASAATRLQAAIRARAARKSTSAGKKRKAASPTGRGARKKKKSNRLITTI